jgi:hypothetical protein
VINRAAETKVGSTMPKKSKPIPVIQFALLKKGHEGITSERETQGHTADLTISLVKALADDPRPEELMAVSHRLGAFKKFIAKSGGGEWAIAVLHEVYHLVNEAPPVALRSPKLGQCPRAFPLRRTALMQFAWQLRQAGWS